ncbi:MAG: glycosyltransferase family 4 protein [Candidatus Glassbacteria bacterium]
MDRKLKIIETAALTWWNASAYYAVAVSRGLKGLGHRLLFIGAPGSPALLKAAEYGIEVEEGIDLKRNTPSGFVKNLDRLRRLFLEFGPDVINAHQGEGHLLCALASRITPGRRVIVRTRADIRRPKTHPLGRVLYGKLTDAVVTSGRFMLDDGYFRNFSFADDKVHNIYAGIDTDYFSPDESERRLRKELGIGKDELLVGIVARLSSVKGHQTFLGAASMVASRIEGVSFLIAGQEEEVSREELMKAAVAGGIARKVHFITRYPDPREIIDAIDIGVIASLGSEAVSRAALEYMAMGRPVVSTTAGVLPEVILDGETGILIKPGDQQEMANALIGLLGDARKRTLMGQAGRRRAVERFSLEEMAKKTETLYLELLERKR